MVRSLLATIFLVGTVTFSDAADIVALCIGNDDYVNAGDKLDTPVADARLMKQALESLPGGADVKLLTDATRVDIVIALNELKDRAKGAKLALVFYSGHGMDGQPRGYATEDTFLLPVEAQIPSEDHLAAAAVGLREVLAALKDCPVTARAVILDCCRTGAPKATGALVAAGTKNFGGLDDRVKAALGKAVVPDATLVAFAASPGRKAASFLRDSDANSPFTLFLAEQLGSGAGNLRDLVEAAAEKTELATERRQVPYVSYNGATSAIKEIVFRETATAPAPTGGSTAEMEALKAQLAAEKKAREEAERKAAMAVTSPASSTPSTMVRTEPSPAGAFAADRGIVKGRPFRSVVATDFVWVEPGTFRMGSTAAEQAALTTPEAGGKAEYYKDEPAHSVTITQGYWMGAHEVTIRDYLKFLNESDRWDEAWVKLDNEEYSPIEKAGDGYRMGSGKGATVGDESQPMVMISWDGAAAYCVWLTEQEKGRLPAGYRFALPSEAEWEMAARGGTTTMTYAGDLKFLGLNNAPLLDNIAWYGGNSGLEHNNGFDSSSWEGKQYNHQSVGTHPVGLKSPNAFGAYDMIGNVLEWCRDWYDETYYKEGQTNPTGATAGSYRVYRGGSWNANAQNCRAANRIKDSPKIRSINLGFRPALSSLPAK